MRHRAVNFELPIRRVKRGDSEMATHKVQVAGGILKGKSSKRSRSDLGLSGKHSRWSKIEDRAFFLIFLTKNVRFI